MYVIVTTICICSYYHIDGNASKPHISIYDQNKIIAKMCVGATKGTYRRDIKIIVNHDYIKQCIIFG